MLNVKLSNFKKLHKNQNQILYKSINVKGTVEVENLINNFLKEFNSFIFESVEKGITRGRYTIFGKDPDKIWEFNNENVYQIKKGVKRKVNGKTVNIINNIINNFKFKTPKGLPQICSLISGYFSYDCIRHIEKIRDTCKVEDEINLLVIQSKMSYSKKLKKNKNKVFIKSNFSKKKFIESVKKAKKYIEIGDIFQVVLSQRFESKLTKTPIDIYKKLRVTNPSPFMFYFNFKDFKIIGASPEILVRLRNEKVTIRPIAGTRPRGKNIKTDNFYMKDLITDKKELSEHLMLLDLGRNDVGKISKIDSVKVTEKFKIEKYSHVMHIVSNVEGKFDNKYSKFKALMAGFPAGTVSGAPKIRAMEIIDELERTKRKIYAGGIGYFSANGDFDTCIALRTAM